MEIIDAHQHFWKPELFAFFGCTPGMEVLAQEHTPADLKPLLDKAGVSRTVLVQTFTNLDHTRDFLAAADANPWVAGVVGWVDLTDPRVGDQLDEFTPHPKFKGMRHIWHYESDAAWNVRDDVINGLRELAKRNVPYDLLVKEPNWAYIPRVAEAVPDLPLVINHIGKPNIASHQFDDWAAAMAKVAQYPQIYCKLSGMVTEASAQWQPADLKPYIEKTIELFGVDRVMFGSDWPVCLLAASYQQVLDALKFCISGLSGDEKAKVLGGNAKAFYKLG